MGFSRVWTACLLILLFERGVEAAAITLAWDPPSDGVTAGYLIQYGTQSRNYSHEIDVGLRTQFSVDGLTPSMRYYFTVVAYDSAGFRSAPSNEVFGVAADSGQFPVEPLPDLLVPVLTASVRNSRIIDLSWPADVGANVIGYRVSVGSAPNRDDAGVFTAGITTRLSIGDLPAGNYYVRVQSLTVGGARASSNEALVTLGSREIARDAPRSLRAVTRGSTLELSWEPPADSRGNDLYVVEMGSTPGGSDQGSFVSRQPTFAIQASQHRTSYVRVRSMRAAAIGSASNEVVAFTEANGALSTCQMPATAPSIVRTTSNGRLIELFWTPALGDKPKRYILEVGSTSGGRDVMVVNFDANTTSYTLQASRGTYFFRVTGVDNCGASEPSSEVAVTAGNRPAVLPGAPLGIARQTSPTTVALTWAPPVTGDAPDHYIVEVTDWDGSPLATLQTGSDATFLHYTVPAVLHVVRVRAANAAGIGPAAPPLTIVMPR